MMERLWFVEHLVRSGAIDDEVARLIDEMFLAPDPERPTTLLGLRVAPASGLLSMATGPTIAVISGLPMMRAPARWCAVAFLNQVTGWLIASKASSSDELVRVIASALPMVAALGQFADEEFQAEFVDFAALCAALDDSLVDQVSLYLQHIADGVGPLADSARRELEQLAR
jgi:hypothetical protein